MLEVEMRMHTEETEQTIKWQSPHLKQITFPFFLKEKSVNINFRGSAFILKPKMHSLKKINVSIYEIKNSFCVLLSKEQLPGKLLEAMSEWSVRSMKVTFRR